MRIKTFFQSVPSTACPLSDQSIVSDLGNMNNIEVKPEETAANPSEQQKRLGRCVDYRKYIYCRLMWIDDGLLERGMTRQLLYIMTHMVLMVTFSFAAFVFATDAKTRFDNLRSFLLECLASSPIFINYFYRKSIARIHRYMDESMSTSRTGLPEEENIIEKARSLSKKQLAAYEVIFILNGLSVAFSQPVTELLQGRSWKKLPFPWIKPSSDFDFFVVFLFQCVGLYFSHCLGMVIMSFSSVTIQMTALFDVLLLSINRIEDRCADEMKARQIDRRSALYECVKADVIHHQQLVRELLSATPHLRWTFLSLSVTISMIMACEAYPLLMGNFTLGELVKGLLFLAVQILCWAQMCFRMEIMSDQNTAVFHALYGTPWYEMEPRRRKLLLTALTFARRPMYIMSPLFTDMSASMATFYSFMISSFNLLNLIRKMK